MWAKAGASPRAPRASATRPLRSFRAGTTRVLLFAQGGHAPGVPRGDRFTGKAVSGIVRSLPGKRGVHARRRGVLRRRVRSDQRHRLPDRHRDDHRRPDGVRRAAEHLRDHERESTQDRPDPNRAGGIRDGKLRRSTRRPHDQRDHHQGRTADDHARRALGTRLDDVIACVDRGHFYTRQRERHGHPQQARHFALAASGHSASTRAINRLAVDARHPRARIAIPDHRIGANRVWRTSPHGQRFRHAKSTRSRP